MGIWRCVACDETGWLWVYYVEAGEEGGRVIILSTLVYIQTSQFEAGGLKLLPAKWLAPYLLKISVVSYTCMDYETSSSL